MSDTSPQLASNQPARSSDWRARFAFVAGTLFLVFLLGFCTAYLRWPPAGFLGAAIEQGRQWLATSSQRVPHHFHPARYELAGAARYDAEGKKVELEARTDEGVTLLTGRWPENGWEPALRVIDGTGKVLHEWKASPTAIWPVSPYHEVLRAIDPIDSFVHGSYLFANGDVVFSSEYLGLVRMNAQGKVLWRLDRRTHHSVSRADDGNFWVGAMVMREKIEEVYPRLAGILPAVVEDMLLQVSPDGEVLREISVLEVLFQSELKEHLWRRARLRNDIVHLNDVEALPKAMADQYPLFAAGDLLVSLRDIDVVMVIDAKSTRVKWWADRPFLRQHDPDFIGDGWISVYDNHADGTPMGQFLGGTRIVKVRPHTGEVAMVYCPGCTPKVGEVRPFYSEVGGKAQLLANDHWLLSEPTAGRVFEIDARGHTTWEWVQARTADGKSISEVMEATRYPYTPQQIATWGAN